MTIFKRGNVWWARVYHDGREGVRSTKIRATSKVEEARAKAVAKELYKKVLSGEFVITDSRGIQKPAEAGSTKLTFEQYSRRWLENHAHRYERATLEGIRTALAEALPVLGPQIMGEIEREDATKVVRRLKKIQQERGNRSSETIKRKLAYIQKIFSDARHEMSRTVTQNPFEKKAQLMEAVGIKVTSKKKRSPSQTHAEPYSREEVALLLAGLDQINPYDQGAVLACLWAGLRRSEALALEISALDLTDNPSLEITQRYSRGQIGETKTDKSERTVPIPLPLRDKLSEVVAHQRREVLRGRRSQMTRWVFPASRSHRDVPMDERNFEERVTTWMRKIEIPRYARPIHRLRHTYASVLLTELGVPISKVSKWLGHSNIDTTVDRYGHLVPDADERVTMGKLAGWHRPLPNNFPNNREGESA